MLFNPIYIKRTKGAAVAIVHFWRWSTPPFAGPRSYADNTNGVCRKQNGCWTTSEEGSLKMVLLEEIHRHRINTPIYTKQGLAALTSALGHQKIQELSTSKSAAFELCYLRAAACPLPQESISQMHLVFIAMIIYGLSKSVGLVVPAKRLRTHLPRALRCVATDIGIVGFERRNLPIFVYRGYDAFVTNRRGYF